MAAPSWRCSLRNREQRTTGSSAGKTQIAFIAEDINTTFELWRSRGVRSIVRPRGLCGAETTAAFYDVDGNSFEADRIRPDEPGA